MGAVPSIPRDRSRQLEVIGAGYGRTGTSAISMALEKLLDGPVMHGGSQILAREDGESLMLCSSLISNGEQAWCHGVMVSCLFRFLPILRAPLPQPTYTHTHTPTHTYPYGTSAYILRYEANL